MNKGKLHSGHAAVQAADQMYEALEQNENTFGVFSRN